MEQRTETPSDVDLARVRAQLVDVTVKSSRRALENLQGERGHDVGLFGNQLTAVDCFSAQCRNQLRPVN